MGPPGYTIGLGIPYFESLNNLQYNKINVEEDGGEEEETGENYFALNAIREYV